MSTHKITRKCTIYVDGNVVDAQPGDTISFEGPEPIEVSDKYLKSCLLSFSKLLGLKSAGFGNHAPHCTQILPHLELPFDPSSRTQYTNAYMRGIMDDKIKFDVAAPLNTQLACYVIHGILTAIQNMPDITEKQYNNAIAYCIRCLELTPEFYNIYKTNIGANNGSET